MNNNDIEILDNNVDNNNISESNNMNNKPKKSKKGLIVIILLLLIIVGLCTFIYMKKDVLFGEVNNNNSNENNTNNDNQENNTINATISDELEKEIKKIVLDFPYAEIACNKDDIYERILNYGVKNTYGCCYTVCASEEKTDKCKKYIKEYEEYDKNKEFYSETQAMGIYDADDVLNTIKKAYNSFSFVDKKKVNINEIDRAIYLKDINRVVDYVGNGGILMPAITLKEVVDTSIENDTYKVQFVESSLEPSDEVSDVLKCNVATKNGTELIEDCRSLYSNENVAKRKEYVLNNKDKLPLYEVSFKINDKNTYEFINVVKK